MSAKLRGLPLDLCRAPVGHCVFLLFGNTASKIRTVKHLQDYPMSVQNMSRDALSRSHDVLCNSAWSGSQIRATLHCSSPSTKYMPSAETCVLRKNIYVHWDSAIGTNSWMAVNSVQISTLWPYLRCVHFLRSPYCYNISGGNLQTLSVKEINQFGLSDEGCWARQVFSMYIIKCSACRKVWN